MKLKELHNEQYRGCNITIEGNFNSEYGVKYKDEWYSGAVYMNLIVNNNLGECVYNKNWDSYTYFHTEDNPQVARFRLVVERKWYKMSPIVVGMTDIKEDYNRVLDDLKIWGKRKVDALTDKEDREISNQLVTDGLPDSLNLL